MVSCDPVIFHHLRNALSEGEVWKKGKMQKMHIAHPDRPVWITPLWEGFL